METDINIMKRLRRKIMRRVWYSYSLRVLLAKATAHGFVLGASTALFFTLVSVPSVLANLLAVEVGEVPSYVWQSITSSVTSGELLQLVALGMLIFSLLSFRITFRPNFREQTPLHV